MKAKDASLWAKIIAGVIIVGGHVCKWLGWLPNAGSGEICWCGLAVMGVFGTVDINIMLEKLAGRSGGQ